MTVRFNIGLEGGGIGFGGRLGVVLERYGGGITAEQARTSGQHRNAVLDEQRELASVGENDNLHKKD